MKKRHLDEGTLPNGVCVHRQLNLTNHYGDDSFHDEWLAQIHLLDWHYSHGGDTKNEAISNLYRYMESQIDNYKQIIKVNQARLDALTEFLQTKVAK